MLSTVIERRYGVLLEKFLVAKGSWREFGDFSEARVDNLHPSIDRSKLNVRIQKMKGGKGGKTVTVITGLNLADAEAKALLKQLKKHCGTGGTIKPNLLELQGDKVETLIDFLYQQGYRPKRSGG